MNLLGKNENNKQEGQDLNLQARNEYLEERAKAKQLVEEYLQRHQELDAREAKLNEQEAALEQERAEWRKKVNLLESKVEEVKEKLVKLNDSISSKEKALQELDEKLTKKQQELIGYETKITQAKADYETRISQLNAKLSEARNNYSALLQELERLRGQKQVKLGKVVAIGEDEDGKFVVYTSGTNKIKTHLKEKDLELKLGNIVAFWRDLSGNTGFLGLLAVPKKKEEPKPEIKAEEKAPVGKEVHYNEEEGEIKPDDEPVQA